MLIIIVPICFIFVVNMKVLKTLEDTCVTEMTENKEDVDTCGIINK